jgi:hypothetical protein
MNNEEENPRFDTEEYNSSFAYQPEKYGIKLIDEIEAERNYDFNMVCIWQNIKTGEYRWGADSGCSCPSPFENIKQWHDLDKLPETMADFEAAVQACGSYRESPSVADKMEFIQKIRKMFA